MFVFYLFMIHNRKPRYLSNIFLPGLLLSARGYVLAWDMVKPLTAMMRISYGFVIVVAIVVAGAYLKQNLIWPNPLSIQPPNHLYSATRRTFERFVDKDYTLFLGVEAYHFLYDYPYKSTFAIENEAAVRHQKILSWAFDWPITERMAIAKDAGQIMIVPDHHDYMQVNFFDERIWTPNFKKVAAVFPPGQTSYFPILYRNDIAANLFSQLRLQPNSSGCDDGVLWIVYNPKQDVSSGITNEEWQALSEIEKQQATLNYFDQRQWFDQPKIESPDKIIQLVRATDQYYALQAQYTHLVDGYYWEHRRTLEQAMDHLIHTELSSEWCRK